MHNVAQEELVESVEDAGFDGRLLGPGAERGTARLHVDGMICSACRCVAQQLGCHVAPAAVGRFGLLYCSLHDMLHVVCGGTESDEVVSVCPGW